MSEYEVTLYNRSSGARHTVTVTARDRKGAIAEAHALYPGSDWITSTVKDTLFRTSA